MIVTDRQLLQRFAEHHEGAAFEALLTRHGPLVLNLCRRLLRDAQAAEDAFQATFLVLARRAGCIRQPESLGSWLYGVAYRVAGKLRRATQRRREQLDSPPLASLPAPAFDPLALVVWQELSGVLDDALHQLPEKYRVPLVLCCLEGQTQSEAARALNWPRASLVSRLDRAKELLRQRLAGSGVALSTSLLVGALTEQAQATLPAGLATRTAKTAVLLQLGSELGGGGPPATVLNLVDGMMRAMLLTKLKYAALTLFAVGLACLGLGLLGREALAERPAPEVAAAPPAPEERPVAAEKDQDPLPAGALARIGSIRFRHGSAVRELAFAPDGKTLFSGGYGAPIRMWELATGKELRTFGGPDDDYVRLALSPDGRLVAGVPWHYVRNDRGWTHQFLAPHVWETATGKEIGVLGGPQEGAFDIVFSDDGKLLATTGRDDKSIHIWDATTCKELRRIPAAALSIALSPGGKLLAAGTDKVTRLWDVASGKELKQLPQLASGRHALAFTPNGKLLLSAGKEVSVFDINDGKEVCKFPAGGRINSLPPFLLAPDGQTALTAAQMSVVVWDVATGKELRRLDHGEAAATTDRVMGMAFAPDGKRIATSARGRGVSLWDAATGRHLARIDAGISTVEIMAFSPDSKVLAAGSDSVLRLWDATTGKEAGPAPVTSRGIYNQSLAGQALVVAQGHADGSISVREQLSGKEIRHLEGHKNGLHTLVLSPDGRTVAASFYMRVARLYDVTSGKVLGEWDRSMLFEGFSPDSKLLLVNELPEGQLALYDVATARPVQRFPTRGNWPQFTPDGRYLATVFGERADEGGARTRARQTIRLYSPETGRELASIPAGGHRPAFSMDSAMVATVDYSADFNSYVIALHELATQKPRLQVQRKLTGPLTPSVLALSADYRVLAAGDEKDIRLWDLATGKELEPWRGHRARIGRLEFSADGRFLTSTSADTTALMWDVAALRAKLPLPRRQLSERECASCWADLAGGDPQRAYQAVWSLAAAPEQSLPFLEKALPPVPRTEPEQIKRLIKDLEEGNFEARKKAAAELEKLAELAEPALRRVLAEKPNLEMRQRVERLLEPLEGPRLTSGDRLRASRAIEVLERLDGPEARRLLHKLSEGAPGALLTRIARSALTRLEARGVVRP
jgi:RNA polymerase sigma factor (sigma-70 family)